MQVECTRISMTIEPALANLRIEPPAGRELDISLQTRRPGHGRQGISSQILAPPASHPATFPPRSSPPAKHPAWPALSPPHLAADFPRSASADSSLEKS